MTYDPDNPFARILRGESSCIKVCETDTELAIMDIMPQADGHVLVIPKEAAADIFELSNNSLVSCMRTAQQIAVAIRAALRPDGVAIMQFNGSAAGQTVAHLHFHIIPRWAGQPLRPHARVPTEPATLESLAQRIRAQLPP